MAIHALHQAWLARMTLVVAPEYQVSPPVTVPSSRHPLPDSIDAYCVYPFAAEDLVARSPHFRSQQLRDQHEKHAKFLREWSKTKERSMKERMQKLAPGWGHGDQTLLQPTKTYVTPSQSTPDNDVNTSLQAMNLSSESKD